VSPGEKDFWLAPHEHAIKLNTHINKAAGIPLPKAPHYNASEELKALAHGLASIAGDPLINVLIAEAARALGPSARPATATTGTPGRQTDIPDLSMRIADTLFCLVGNLLRKELGWENGRRFDKSKALQRMKQAHEHTAPRVFTETAKALQDVPKPKEPQVERTSSTDGTAAGCKTRSTTDANSARVLDEQMASEAGREDSSQQTGTEEVMSRLRKRDGNETNDKSDDKSRDETQTVARPTKKKKRTTSQEMPNVEFSVGSVSFTGKTKQMKIKIITEDGTTTKNPCDILGASTVIDAIFQNQASKLKFCRYMYDAEVDWQRRQTKLQSQPEKAEVAGDKQKELNRLLADKEALDNKIATLRQSLEPQQ